MERPPAYVRTWLFRSNYWLVGAEVAYRMSHSSCVDFLSWARLFAVLEIPGACEKHIYVKIATIMNRSECHPECCRIPAARNTQGTDRPPIPYSTRVSYEYVPVCTDYYTTMIATVQYTGSCLPYCKVTEWNDVIIQYAVVYVSYRYLGFLWLQPAPRNRRKCFYLTSGVKGANKQILILNTVLAVVVYSSKRRNECPILRDTSCQIRTELNRIESHC